jgi:hypothetical protein
MAEPFLDCSHVNAVAMRESCVGLAELVEHDGIRVYTRPLR